MQDSVLSAPPCRSAGMSLIELMIAIALGLLILAALTVVFVNTSTARREIELTGQQIENGRYAVSILSDDLRMAGYFGELNPAPANESGNTGSDPNWLPAVVPPAAGAMPDPCTIPADLKDWRASLYFHVQGYPKASGLAATTCDDRIAAAGTSIKSNTDATTNPDVVVVRRVRACSEGDPGCPTVDNNKAYLQVSLCATEATSMPYILALGSVAPTLRFKGATAATCGAVVSRREYMTHVYFVSPDNGAGVNVPTLKRLELDVVGGSLSMRVVSLVEGIEQLNIEYGIDYMDNAGLPGADGIPDAYTPDPTNFPTNYSRPTGCATCAFNDVDNWRNVVSARFHVLARNLEHSAALSDEAKNKIYTLGRKPDGVTPLTVGPFSDNYRRHVYSSLVRISNPAGRRDRP